MRGSGLRLSAVPQRVDESAGCPTQASRQSSASKNKLESELNHARVDARIHNLPEIWRGYVGQSRLIGNAVRVRVVKLRVIEDVEELCPELQRTILSQPGVLENRKVPVELARAEDDSHSRIPESRTVSDDGRGAECSGVEVARPAAVAAQPLFNASGGS